MLTLPPAFQGLFYLISCFNTRQLGKFADVHDIRHLSVLLNSANSDPLTQETCELLVVGNGRYVFGTRTRGHAHVFTSSHPSVRDITYEDLDPYIRESVDKVLTLIYRVESSQDIHVMARP